uniref:Uncharacterized protein n=1 Tax=Arundo donax TaxID=35708 RepID=A0A0A9HR82_ARUDO
MCSKTVLRFMDCSTQSNINHKTLHTWVEIIIHNDANGCSKHSTKMLFKFHHKTMTIASEDTMHIQGNLYTKPRERNS